MPVENTYTLDQLRALACALASLRKTAGGYSPAEIEKAITELQSMYEKGLEQLK